jgi:hypothetical protein
MTTTLDWKPDPYLPHSDLVARVDGATYRVTSWPPCMTNAGAYSASAGPLSLGWFPHTPEGKRAALLACQLQADTVGDAIRLRAQSARVVHNPEPVI